MFSTLAWFQFLVDRHEQKAFWQKKHILDTIFLGQKLHDKSALLQLIIVIYPNDKQEYHNKNTGLCFSRIIKTKTRDSFTQNNEEKMQKSSDFEVDITRAGYLGSDPDKVKTINVTKLKAEITKVGLF